VGYQWWVFAHLAAVFVFMAAHGVSMVVAIRLRAERDPARINALLDLSGRTVVPANVSLLVLFAAGVVATFVGHLWRFGWIWAAIGALVVTSGAMYFMGRPYYQKVRFIARAVADGSQAVTPEQFDSVLRSRRAEWIAGIGVAGLVFILYLMLFKPTLGLAPGAPPVAAPSGPTVRLAAQSSRFSSSRVTAPAGVRFAIAFTNADSGVPHNISIYADASAARSLFAGSTFPGPAERVYSVSALQAGSYFFRCDVHPTTMTGTLVVT
jgi:plastocyanin